MAYCFNTCSRERAKSLLLNQQEESALLVLKEYTTHDTVIANIKRLPFRFRDREFVTRQLAARSEAENGANSDAAPLMIVFEGLKEGTVDYGASFRTVRGFMRACWEFAPLPGREHEQCFVKCHQYLDAGGVLPQWLLSQTIPRTLAGLVKLRDNFQRDDVFDKEELEKKVTIIQNEEQFYSGEESRFIDQIERKIAVDLAQESMELQSPDVLVAMSLRVSPQDGIGVMRASTVLDASVEECAARELSPMTRELQKSHFESGGRERTLTKRNDHSAIFRVVYDFHIPGFQLREFLTSQMWKKLGNDTIVVLSDSVDVKEEFPINPNYMRATATSYWKFERLPKFHGVDQTRATFVEKADMKGAILKSVVNAMAVTELMYLSRAREKLDKSLKIDAAGRARMVDMINSHTTAYTERENQIVDQGLGNFAQFLGLRAKNLKMPSPATSAKMSFMDGDSHAWGYARTVVRETPKVILAGIFDTFSRANTYSDTLEKAVDDAPNDHNQLVYVLKKSPASAVANRDFLTRNVWKALDDGGFALVRHPEESAGRPQTNGSSVRAKYSSAFKLTKVDGGRTRLELVIHPDPGGQIPKWVFNRYLRSSLAYVSEIRTAYQSLRGLEIWDEEDGKAVGDVLVTKTTAEKHRKRGETMVGARLRKMFKEDRGLKEIGKKYEFFQDMMVRVVQNKLRPASDVKIKACNLRSKEGERIGAGLSASLASSLTAEAAVDEWIGKYPALQELDRAEIWFRPMMDVVATRLLGEVSWGTKMRSWLSAGLSMLDMASDINVITVYWSIPEKKAYGVMLVGMLATCMSIHLLMVFGQSRKRPLKMLTEALIVLTGLKPGKRRIWRRRLLYFLFTNIALYQD
jgi:hypothetical protein